MVPIPHGPRLYGARLHCCKPSAARILARFRMSTTLVIIEHTDNHSHVQIVGPLDLAGVGMIELKFTASTASKRKHAIVDMSQVPFMASLGMGMLVQVARTLSADGRKVVLVAPTDIVATALRTSRLDAVMPIVEHLEAAKAHLEA